MVNVIGTWRLVKATSRDAEGRDLPPPYGGHAIGRVVLGAEGRMVAVICDSRTAIPPGETREYTSYCGAYTYDGTRLVTRVDAASDPSRMGTDQVREVRFEDGLMVLRPPQRSYGGRPAEQREIWWEKIAEV